MQASLPTTFLSVWWNPHLILLFPIEPNVDYKNPQDQPDEKSLVCQQLFSTQQYRQEALKRRWDGPQYLLLPNFPDYFDLQTEPSPCCKGL
jgi:hypothetical protein